MILREVMEEARYKQMDWEHIASNPVELAASGATKEQADYLVSHFKQQYEALREVLGVNNG